MKRIRVLLVEDDPAARALADAFFRTVEDIELCAAARDGLEGLDCLHRERPDAVLLDLVLPGLDGMGFLHCMNETPPLRRPEIVVVSGVSSQKLIQRALGLGAAYYFIKPVNLEALSAVLRTLCGSSLREEAAAWLAEMGGAGMMGARAAASAAAALAEDRTGRMLLKQAYAEIIREQNSSYTCVEKNIRDMVNRLHQAARPAYLALMEDASPERPSNEAFLHRLAAALLEKRRERLEG